MRLSKPRHARPVEPTTTVPRAAVRARADVLLQLQRTVGNRATRRLLQRNGHENWALGASHRRRETIDKRRKRPWAKTALIAGKEEPVGSTLHHVISKTTLDWIVDELDVALESPNRTLETAAKNFDTALEKAIAAADLGEGTSRKKQAWNLPFNLIAGPNDPSEDPGERFDAGHIMSTAPDGSRSFTETVLTGHLRALEDALREGRRKKGIGEGLTADAWDRMTTAFKAARDLRGDTDVDVNEQEWMSFTSGKGAKLWIRSGERRYPGVTLGKQLFPRAAIACPAINTVSTAQTVSFPLSRDEDGEIGSSRAYLSVSIPGQTIKHVWERHTYAGFTMAPDDMKAVNTFFRATNLAIADVQRMVNQSLDAMVNAIRSHIEDAAVGMEDTRLFTEDRDIDLTRVDTPAGRLYVKCGFEHFTHDIIQRKLLTTMTELPDPEKETEKAPEPAPVKAPVKAASSTGTSKKDKRKARQRAQAEAEAEAEAEPEPAPAPVAPKTIAKPTHGWQVKLKTIAPDGPAADAYTRDELMVIKTALGR